MLKYTTYVFLISNICNDAVYYWIGEDLFLVTKLPPSGNRPEGVSKFIKKSLENLQVSYLDLYLVHTPFGFKDIEGDLHPMKDGQIDMDIATDHVAVWKVSTYLFIINRYYENII